MASFRDITDRKNLETQLLQAQKLESIGELAAGIAHEINTPTQFVGDNARFLQDAFKDILSVIQMYRQLGKSPGLDDAVKKLLEQIAAAEKKIEIDYLLNEIPTSIFQSLEGVDRISKIVLAMKEFSHPGGNLKKASDINRALQNTITVARNEWKYVADVETDFAHDLPALQCFPGELNQVFLNIIVNAAQAIGELHKIKPDKTIQKGKIAISTRKDGAFAEIRIADDGPGISKNIQHKIFDPFFTTKEVGKGTGQGLAIAHSVITDKHSGTITVESEVGKGTVFIIRLPIE